LPWWFWLAYADVTYWLITVPAALVLGLVGWYGARWLGGLSWVAFAGAALLAVPFPVAGLLLVVLEIRDAIKQATLQRTLAHDEILAGLPLPAGSRIRFRDKEHSHIVSIDLPHAADIFGMRLEGTLRRDDRERLWSGTLAENQWIDGWPCRAGTLVFEKDGIAFDDGGVVRRCTLAAPHELLGLRLPPGTRVTRGGEEKPWNLLLPADAGVDIPTLATTAPPGVTLWLANDGRLERMGCGHGQTIVVRGVLLNTADLRLRGEQLVADLAVPCVIAGETEPAGRRVAIDLTSGSVSVQTEAA
jgi:hypothetical protein